MSIHLGTILAHFFEMALAAPRVVAFFKSGTLFQTLAMILEASMGYPGTGSGISQGVVDLVCLKLVLSRNRHCQRGSIICFDFQTVVAIVEATNSFRHLRLALCKTSSEFTLLLSLVLVIVRADYFMALFISSVTTILYLSSW